VEKETIKTHVLDVSWKVWLAIILFAGMIGEGRAQDLYDLRLPEIKIMSDQRYWVHNSCNVGNLPDIIDQSFQELERYTGYTFTNVGTGYTLNPDFLNTISCEGENPFETELIDRRGAIGERTYNIEGTLGAARTRWYKDSGKIAEWDIWINEEVKPFINIVKTTVKHELGHAVGLQHTWTRGSLMFPSSSTTFWDIETIARLSLLYDRCTVEGDEDLNIWLPNAQGFHGIMHHRGDGTWVTSNVSSTNCGD